MVDNKDKSIEVEKVEEKQEDNLHKRLSLKQQKFVDAYIANGGNATEAALVSYNCKDRVDAGNIGSQNMAKPYIQNVIQTKVKELKDKVMDKFKNNDLMGLALDTAHSDLTDDDPKVRESARKYVLEVAKFISETERVPPSDTHNHLHIPAWKQGSGTK